MSVIFELILGGKQGSDVHKNSFSFSGAKLWLKKQEVPSKEGKT